MMARRRSVHFRFGAGLATMLAKVNFVFLLDVPNPAFVQKELKVTCVPLVVDFAFPLNMMILVGMPPVIHFAFMLDAMKLVLSFLRGNV